MMLGQTKIKFKCSVILSVQYAKFFYPKPNDDYFSCFRT